MVMLQQYDYYLVSIRQFLDMFPANLQNAYGKTALMIAIEKGNASSFALLLERFPDIDLQQHIANLLR